MRNLRNFVRKTAAKAAVFLESKKGQATSEYGFLILLLIIGLFVVVVAFRDQLISVFNNIINKFKSVNT